MKIGMEIEFWVVDERGALCDGRVLTEAHERIEPEFIAPLVEIRTEPHEHRYALQRELGQTLRTAIRAADDAGKRLVPLGTPLTTAAPPATTERGKLFEQIYRDGVLCAKNCAGMHVHFEKSDVTHQLNTLTMLDPALALVSSSPYYDGKRAMDSSRAHAYRTLCGEDFRQFCDLWPFADSVTKWELWIDERYERFEALAGEQGVSPARVARYFTPESTVLTPVRLRTSLPTVEWRAPDTALPTQLVQLAFDVRSILKRSESSALDTRALGTAPGQVSDPSPKFRATKELSHEAIAWGLQSRRVRDYLTELGFDLTAYDPISQRLRGPNTLSERKAREVRLEYAMRLRRDIDRLEQPPRRVSAEPTAYT